MSVPSIKVRLMSVSQEYPESAANLRYEFKETRILTFRQQPWEDNGERTENYVGAEIKLRLIAPEQWERFAIGQDYFFDLAASARNDIGGLAFGELSALAVKSNDAVWAHALKAPAASSRA